MSIIYSAIAFAAAASRGCIDWVEFIKVSLSGVSIDGEFWIGRFPIEPNNSNEVKDE